MQDTRFDTLAKEVGALMTRRLMVGTLVSGVVGWLGFADAGATPSGKCKPKCTECTSCKQGKCHKKDGKKVCKQGKCKPKAAGTPCTLATGRSGVCQIGACVAAPVAPVAPGCTEGLTSCSGVCVDLQSDLANCGACGKACGVRTTFTETCGGGRCCIPDLERCIEGSQCCSENCEGQPTQRICSPRT